ncbi:hypothetical protein M758_6G050200 [Ceratodon purpureus]|nr:hypothetical protein M758_6G050200 [Ceratodon purpureus]
MDNSRPLQTMLGTFIVFTRAREEIWGPSHPDVGELGSKQRGLPFQSHSGVRPVLLAKPFHPRETGCKASVVMSVSWRE